MIGASSMIRSADGLEQELENLHMTDRMRQRLTPGVQPVPTQEKRMASWVFGEHLPHAAGQVPHILIILENRNPLLMLVCDDAFEPLQHLVACNSESTWRRVTI